MDATTGALLTAALTIAMGLVKVVEMFAKPLIEDRHQRRRSTSAESAEKCRLTETDRAQLFTVQARVLDDISKSTREQTEILRGIHVGHGAKLDRLVDMHEALAERRP